MKSSGEIRIVGIHLKKKNKISYSYFRLGCNCGLNGEPSFHLELREVVKCGKLKAIFKKCEATLWCVFAFDVADMNTGCDSSCLCRNNTVVCPSSCLLSAAATSVLIFYLRFSLCFSGISSRQLYGCSSTPYLEIRIYRHHLSGRRNQDIL